MLRSASESAICFWTSCGCALASASTVEICATTLGGGVAVTFLGAKIDERDISRVLVGIDSWCFRGTWMDCWTRGNDDRESERKSGRSTPGCDVRNWVRRAPKSYSLALSWIHLMISRKHTKQEPFIGFAWNWDVRTSSTCSNSAPADFIARAPHSTRRQRLGDVARLFIILLAACRRNSFSHCSTKWLACEDTLKAKMLPSTRSAILYSNYRATSVPTTSSVNSPYLKCLQILQ